MCKIMFYKWKNDVLTQDPRGRQSKWYALGLKTKSKFLDALFIIVTMLDSNDFFLKLIVAEL